MKRIALALVVAVGLGGCCGAVDTAASGTASGSGGGTSSSASSSSSSSSSSEASSSSSSGTGGAPNCITVIVAVAAQSANDTPTIYPLVTVQSPGTLDVSIQASSVLAADDADFWGFALERNGAVWVTGAATKTIAGGGVGDLGLTPVALYSGLPLVAGDEVALLIGPTLHPSDLPASQVIARVCAE